MKNKKTLISVLATVLCCSTLAAVGTIAASADTVGTVDASSFAMVSGASVRIGDGTVENPYGIRFTATMDPTAYTDLENLEKTAGVSVNYGMIILPYDKLPATYSDLKDVFFGTNSGFCFEKSGHLDTCEKYHVQQVKTAGLNTADEDYADKAVLKGSITNVLDENRTRPFVGVGYIEHDDNGTKTYVIADYKDDDIQNNVSSMTYVAQKAVEDTDEDAPTEAEKKTLTASYITPFDGKTAKYTVNEYILDDAGNVTSQNTRTAEATFNKAITYAYDTTLDTDFNKSLKSYIVSQNKGLLTSNVYANNRTELNVYYSKTISDLSSAEDTDYFYVPDFGTSVPADKHVLNSSMTHNAESGTITIVADNAYATSAQVGSVALKLTQDQHTWLSNTADFDYISIRMKAKSGISGATLCFAPEKSGVDYDTSDQVQDEWFELKLDKENLTQNVHYNASATRKSFWVSNIKYRNATGVQLLDRYSTGKMNYYSTAGTANASNFYEQDLPTLTTITYEIDKISIGKDEAKDTVAPTFVKVGTDSTYTISATTANLAIPTAAHAYDDVSHVATELLGITWTTTLPSPITEEAYAAGTALTLYTAAACTTAVTARIFPSTGRYVEADGSEYTIPKATATVYIKPSDITATGYSYLLYKYRIVDAAGNATIAYGSRRLNKTA